MISLLCSVMSIACGTNLEHNNYFNNAISVTSVYDGDTIKITYPGLPEELGKLSVRVRGVDTPELRGKCTSEKKKAQLSKKFTKNIIEKNGNKVILENMTWDKYGGRVLADVYIIEKTKIGYTKINLSNMIIKSGHGRKYDGNKRSNWC